MMSAELIAELHGSGACFADNTASELSVDHFGDCLQEQQAADEAVVICPLSSATVVRVTGRDRAKFLHNFCTSNIVAMTVGDTLETFFTDVKAKIVAHGQIHSAESHHDIVLLNSDGQRLIKHLSRYIISEDVTVAAVAQQTTFAVVGPHPASIVTEENVVARTRWSEHEVFFLSIATSEAATFWQQSLQAGVRPAGEILFHHLRIMEGYPLIGIDLTEDNLAPEAARIQQTISYKKGCYLGQEPIARLDALGHVNRQLYRGLATVLPEGNSDGDLVAVTSASRMTGDSIPVLMTLPVKRVSESGIIFATLPDGRKAEVTVHST